MYYKSYWVWKVFLACWARYQKYRCLSGLFEPWGHTGTFILQNFCYIMLFAPKICNTLLYPSGICWICRWTAPAVLAMLKVYLYSIKIVFEKILATFCIFSSCQCPSKKVFTYLLRLEKCKIRCLLQSL